MLEVQLAVSSDERLKFCHGSCGFSSDHLAVLLEGQIFVNMNSEVLDVVGPIDFFVVENDEIFLPL